jgi:hypothetical protein
VDAIAAIVEEIVTRPAQATTFAQIADLLAEGFLKGNRNKGLLRQIFPADGLAAKVALVRNFLVTLASMGAVPDDVKQMLDARPSEAVEPSAKASSSGPVGKAAQPELFSATDERPNSISSVQPAEEAPKQNVRQADVKVPDEGTPK